MALERQISDNLLRTGHAIQNILKVPSVPVIAVENVLNLHGSKRYHMPACASTVSRSKSKDV